MKKLSFLILSLFAFSFVFVACDPEDKPNVDDIVEDGFYVVGEATAVASLTADGANKAIMAVGFNEVLQSKDGVTDEEKVSAACQRAGMYEKYIVLEGGKPFSLVLKEGKEETKYGATLEAVELGGVDEQPNITVQKGVLAENTTMQVSETGLYHIVLDLNLNNDLPNKLILVAPVTLGVRGGMNSWGFSEMASSEINKNTITYTIEDQELPVGGIFKFAYGGGWKIQLDEEGLVKANTNLGKDLKPGAGNIAVEAAGLYKITLTYTLAQGDINSSFSYTAELTQASSMPENMYMTGTDFGGWTWGSEGIVSLVPVHSAAGSFWTIKYLKAGNGMKFSEINIANDWSKAFAGLGENIGFSFDGDGNAVVAEDGIYMIYVDSKNNKLAIEPAKVYLTGEALTGGWGNEAAEFLFAAEGNQLASPLFTSGGNLRIFAASSIATTDWWTREFNVFDGKIEYRGAGDDQAAVAVTAGQKVTLDFNAGTGTIQ